jgi:hypothetical protein
MLKKKEGLMRIKIFPKWLYLAFLVLLLLPFSNVEAKERVELVGKETLNFTLPSTLDRVINYANEYYGRYHLIITFFPAAYTPI